MTNQRLRVGIVGCGAVATHHARFIFQHSNADLVGIADISTSKANALAERFGVSTRANSIEEILDKCSLDVVHILTPPTLHFQHAQTAIRLGVNVLVEKPTTTKSAEAEALYESAEAAGILLCPDFIQLFHPAALRLEEIALDGRYGKLVHVECNFTIDPWSQDVAESTGLHWSFRLPYGFFQNFISHPLYLVLRWTGSETNIHVSSRSTGSLPHGLTDHIELLIEGEAATGRVIMSTAAGQPAYYLRAFFERGNVTIDFPTNTLISKGLNSLPNVVERGLSNFTLAAGLVKEGARNIGDFALGRLVPYQGLKVLMDRFYTAVLEGGEPPVSKSLALGVAISEETALKGLVTTVNLKSRPASKNTDRIGALKVLLTGATGYLGSELARQLVQSGYYVRTLVRPLARVEHLENIGTELVFGDVRDREVVFAACREMDYVIHCAAALSGTLETMMRTSVVGTQNIIDGSRDAGVRLGVYISSCAVYDYSALRNSDIITESTSLEETPSERGGPTMAKRAAEEIALTATAAGTWSILRPSLLVGNGRSLTSPVGAQIGRTLICFGGPGKKLRLIHVEDAAQAAVTLLTHPESAGKIFLVSHPQHPTFRQYVNSIVRVEANRRVPVIYLRRWMFEVFSLGLRTLRIVSKRIPTFSRKRRDYLYRDVEVDSSLIRDTGILRPSKPILEQLDPLRVQYEDDCSN